MCLSSDNEVLQIHIDGNRKGLRGVMALFGQQMVALLFSKAENISS